MLEFVKTDVNVMHGAPCFTGTRVTIQTFFDWMEEGSSIDYFLEQFPSVSRDQVIALLESAKQHAIAEAVTVQ